jgi:nucleoside-diphosphate-sugar epimerase
MNILVTGSEGIVGQSIVAEIARRWPAAKIVRASSRSLPGVCAVDLRERRQVIDLIRREAPDVVIHGSATPYESWIAKPIDAWDHVYQDLQMTANILEAASIGSVTHVTLLSSAMVTDGEVTAGGAASSPIAIAKKVAEGMVGAWARNTGGTHTTWRLFNVISPAEPHDRHGHVCVDLYRRIFLERAAEIEIPGGGNQMRCYSWVGDVAQAIVGYLFDTRAKNGTFNLGSDEARSVAQLARALIDAGVRLGMLFDGYDPPIRETPAIARDVISRVPDISEARSRLGWAPTTSFDACVENFVRGKRDRERR